MNVQDSASFLVNSIKYLAKSPKESYYNKPANSDDDTSEKNYVNVVKSAKRKHNTKQHW